MMDCSIQKYAIMEKESKQYPQTRLDVAPLEDLARIHKPMLIKPLQIM